MRHIGYTLLGLVLLVVGGFVLMAVFILLLGVFESLHNHPEWFLYGAISAAAAAVCWWIGKVALPTLKTFFY
jgi:hypothetical protein